MKSLERLCDDLGLVAPAGRAGIEVSGLCHDSRRVQPGDLYLALPGSRFDGRLFVAEAEKRGALAWLGPARIGPGPRPQDSDLPWIEHADPRALMARLAAWFYGHVDEKLALVGVTGTNGKSTTVALVTDLLVANGRPAATLGTLGYEFAGRAYQVGAGRTTPEVTDLCRALAEMARDGASAAAMEVSSHALELGRVEGLRFDVALFTNLTRDHLDFHPDMEAYFAAKRKLFERLKPKGRAVVNLGDAWGRRLADDHPGALTFGLDAGDVRAREVTLDLEGIRGRIDTPRGGFSFETRLLGRYNLENLLGAVAVGEALGLDHQKMAAALAKRGPVAGRLESVGTGSFPGAFPGAFPALVDYAHTPIGLEALLRSVRELSQRRILLVFGCGGERDAGKRPLMGQIAGELADLAIITSDNPRREEPLQIVAQVEQGLKQSVTPGGSREYLVLPDRQEAIARAVHLAATRHRGHDWVVLVAGKGHESTQDLGDRVIPFLDRQVLETALHDEFQLLELLHG